MARINTTVEAGRKYDIDFVSWTEDVQGEAQFTFGNRSRKTTGLVKAVNRFLKLLLTRRGSDPFSPNSGTSFEDAQYRGGDTDSELGTFISEQLSSALNQVLEIQASADFPDDENIISANLERINRIAVDHVEIYINILSEAGEGTSVYIPIIGG